VNGDEELGHLYRQALADVPGGQLDPAQARAAARRRRHQRTVAAGVVAVVAAAAAVALPVVRSAPITAEPAAPVLTATAAPSPSATQTPRSTSPGRTVRLLSSVQTAAVVERCRASVGATFAVQRVDLAVDSAVAGPAVLFTDVNGNSYACDDHGSRRYAGPGSTAPPLVKPSRAAPAIRITGGGVTSSVGSTGTLNATTTTAYRLDRSVDRVQVRIKAGNEQGPWFDAAVHQGYAYGGATMSISNDITTDTSHSETATFTVEDRALDRKGRQLTISHLPSR